MRRFDSRLRIWLTPSLGLLSLALAGCATVARAPTAAGTATPPPAAGTAPFVQAATPPAAGASAAAASGAAPSPPAVPGQPPVFATVIKDAKKTDGLFGYWQKDDKVWLELKPEDFNKPFFLSPKLARGIGEAGIFGGSMYVPNSRVYERIVEFRKVHSVIQLVELNTDYVARDPKSPQARAVAASFSPSLLASAPVASLAHPERKTVLVDAGPLFLNDMLGLGTALQRAFRQGYALEARNTQFTSLRNTPEQLVLNVNAHFYSANIAVPQPGMPPGAPVPLTPRALPDPRSMMLGLYYSLSKLPEVPMARPAAFRVAAPRCWRCRNGR